ncbi:MAG: hypothetical protein AAF682_13920 [Planctomycetota bacterium]
MQFRALRACGAFVGFALASSTASAQLTVGGNVFDGSGGPLLPNTVYEVTSSLVVPAGQTLTIGEGAIVKFSGIQTMTVDGLLVSAGVAGNPVVLTSIEDDSQGGDTGGDGQTQGSAGDWRGLRFSASSDGSSMSSTQLWFAGQAGLPTIDLFDADVSLTDCSLNEGLATPLDLSNNTLGATISGCALLNHQGTQGAVTGVDINALPGFSGNVASGNAGGDFQRVTIGALSGDLTIVPDNLLGGVLVHTVGVDVPAGVTLTLAPGVVVKPRTTTLRWLVDGTLVADGTAVEPIVFTSFADDDNGGDTNVDGPSSGSPGDWRNLQFRAGSDSSVLDRVLVAFGGQAGLPQVDLFDADITISDCTVRDGLANALDLSNNTLGASISGCALLDHVGTTPVISGVHVRSLPGFNDNVAAGNPANYQLVSVGGLSGDLDVGTDNLLGGVLVHSVGINIPAGDTFRLEPDVVVKPRSSTLTWDVDGTLLAEGEPGKPVVFTSFADDSEGGDTNGDGPSVGSPGDWRNISFGAMSGASVLEHTVVAYGGQAGLPGIDLFNADVTLNECVVRDGLGSALDLSNNTLGASITRCTFDDHVGSNPVVTGVDINALPSFVRNGAQGNAGGDYQRVSVGQVDGELAIARHNLLNDVLVHTVGLSVPAASYLSVGSGVVVKPRSTTLTWNVNGRLDLLGTGYEPIVFTAWSDDTWAGDTNGDGDASLPAPGAWRALNYDSTAIDSLAENVLLRYGGQAGLATLDSETAQLELRSVRIEHALANGFDLEDGKSAWNLVAFACGGDGILLRGGSFDLAYATAAVNGGNGVERLAAYGGSAVNSISWANGGDGFAGFAGGELFNSNGSAALAGSNGNLFLDPLFTDASAGVGDLSLSAGSPCLNAADMLLATNVVKDHLEAPRLLDPNLSGAFLPDMGAYERARWRMDVTGTAQLGDVLTFTVEGPPGISGFVLGFNDIVFFFPELGYLLTIGGSSIIVLGNPLVGEPYVAPIGTNPSTVGASFAIQGAAIDPLQSLGNMLNLYRATVLP